MYEEICATLKQCGFPDSYYYCGHGCPFAKNGTSCNREDLLHAAAGAIETLCRQTRRWELEAAALQTDKEYLMCENRKLVEAWLNALHYWTPVETALPMINAGDIFSRTVFVTDGEFIRCAELMKVIGYEPYAQWTYTGLGEITHWAETLPLPKIEKEAKS